MAGRLFPAPDPRQFYDAPPHSQRHQQLGPVPRHRRHQQRLRQGLCDITTRQQIQLRWFQIDQVQEIWDRLEAVGLVSLQTGMDNIRGIVGCPVAGLTPNELFDASPVVREFNDIFLGDRAYTNLPRKFNAAITGCLDNCTHAITQDIALTPAIRVIAGQEVRGFNVAVGGKQGSGGFRPGLRPGRFRPA